MENMSQEQINGLHALIAIVVFIIGICCYFAYKTIVRARQAKELAKKQPFTTKYIKKFDDGSIAAFEKESGIVTSLSLISGTIPHLPAGCKWAYHKTQEKLFFFHNALYDSGIIVFLQELDSGKIIRANYENIILLTEAEAHFFIFHGQVLKATMPDNYNSKTTADTFKK